MIKKCMVFTISTYHTCPRIWNSLFYCLFINLKYCCMYAIFCSIWSGSTLFAKTYLSQYLGLLQYFFLISLWKNMLWVHIRSISVYLSDALLMGTTKMFCKEIRKNVCTFWLRKMPFLWNLLLLIWSGPSIMLLFVQYAGFPLSTSKRPGQTSCIRGMTRHLLFTHALRSDFAWRSVFVFFWLHHKFVFSCLSSRYLPN